MEENNIPLNNAGYKPPESAKELKEKILQSQKTVNIQFGEEIDADAGYNFMYGDELENRAQKVFEKDKNKAVAFVLNKERKVMQYEIDINGKSASRIEIEAGYLALMSLYMENVKSTDKDPGVLVRFVLPKAKVEAIKSRGYDKGDSVAIINPFREDSSREPEEKEEVAAYESVIKDLCYANGHCPEGTEKVREDIFKSPVAFGEVHSGIAGVPVFFKQMKIKNKNNCECWKLRMNFVPHQERYQSIAKSYLKFGCNVAHPQSNKELDIKRGGNLKPEPENQKRESILKGSLQNKNNLDIKRKGIPEPRIQLKLEQENQKGESILKDSLKAGGIAFGVEASLAVVGGVILVTSYVIEKLVGSGLAANILELFVNLVEKSIESLGEGGFGLAVTGAVSATPLAVVSGKLMVAGIKAFVSWLNTNNRDNGEQEQTNSRSNSMSEISDN